MTTLNKEKAGLNFSNVLPLREKHGKVRRWNILGPTMILLLNLGRLITKNNIIFHRGGFQKLI